MDIQKILANAQTIMSSMKKEGSGKSMATAGIEGMLGEGDDPTTMLQLKDSANIKSGKYSKSAISNWARAAKAAGVDPYQMIALGWQEGNLMDAVAGEKKTLSDGSVRRSRSNAGQVKDFSESQLKELTALSEKNPNIPQTYLKSALAFRDKLKYADTLGLNKTEAMKLQAYNGYGKLMPQKDASGKPVKMYGQVVPATGIDMRTTPLYGNRLVALKKDLMANKELAALIGDTKAIATPIQNPILRK